MINFGEEAMPEELKQDIRIKLVMEHSYRLADEGVVQYSKSETPADLSPKEKMLIGFYAVAIAMERENYKQIAPLAGFMVYGFIINGQLDMAEHSIKRVIDVQNGGTLPIAGRVLLNLDWVKKSISGDNKEVLKFIDRMKAYVLEYIGTNVELMLNVEILLDKREAKAKVFRMLAAAIVFIAQAGLVVGAAMGTVYLLKLIH